jgi:hypothetical protein
MTEPERTNMLLEKINRGLIWVTALLALIASMLFFHFHPGLLS